MKFARLSICAVLVLGMAIASAATAATFTVNPPGPIQPTINSAAAGDTIIVMPGNYNLEPGAPAAIMINKPLTLIAKSKPPAQRVRILPNPTVAGQIHGILVDPGTGNPDIDGLTIQGFTVEGFPNMGIYLRHVKNFDIEKNESINNLENGIFPTLSANGLVKKNIAYGSQDSALWVEGSQNVRVIGNDLHHSPTGLEITISNEITVEQNKIHENTIGVGLYHPATAGLPQSEWPTFAGGYGSWHVTGNRVYANNSPNQATTGSETSQLPWGGGILLLGVDNVDVQKNKVEYNDFFGIGVVDYCLAVLGTSFDCSTNPPPMETAPDNNKVIGNKLTNNHAAPPLGPYQGVAADVTELQLDTSSHNNCYSNNMILNTPPLPIVTNPDPLAPACP